ncbi:precorrin-2 dehydrogenase/sirohydrochlorin ferrochelatase family protein [Photobacterium carnosum]|uniref:precorrin-2 dehydrogenase n=1 Tax=Photobacterium carnosum TaxID=2023717 RepID=A0A2N4UVQ0_9GAMM|nr:NAD(P)-dependent oxidoreductase [Photobacterium carnosum]MCD9494143.1 siroheme synthase [Photobacterium carnosum]MCD9514316.1 siroheme synthase [Photobacterium carnosum]MCD9521510.1 siroheme synthase [Photobacterium carnosum]MCD9540973.1 siroheme synthase [Photobacterium carnosum]PLC59100.1 siroheme synthase [Photobacterium carnosum]
MDFFPIFLKVNHKQILVIGGGDVACRKVDLLLKAHANVTVVSPQLHPHLQMLLEQQLITHIDQPYQSSQLSGADQVWATTDSAELNHQIYHDASALKIWTNVVDDPTFCDFITPSIVDRSPIQVAISSGGTSPVLVRYLRERLETYLPQNLSLLATFAGKQRQRIKQHFTTVDERRKFWEQFFRLSAVENAHTTEELEAAFQQLLTEENHCSGNIYLIETGHDPELISLKALRLMQQSEYILYHDDVADVFIDLCRRDADRERCDHKNIQALTENLMQQGIRVCILATKDNHRPCIRKYCASHNGIFVPIFG